MEWSTLWVSFSNKRQLSNPCCTSFISCSQPAGSATCGMAAIEQALQMDIITEPTSEYVLEVIEFFLSQSDPLHPWIPPTQLAPPEIRQDRRWYACKARHILNPDGST